MKLSQSKPYKSKVMRKAIPLSALAIVFSFILFLLVKLPKSLAFQLPAKRQFLGCHSYKMTATVRLATSIMGNSIPSSKDDETSNSTSNNKCQKSRKTKKIHSFTEARRIARGHGFSSIEEFIEYECAGAYQVPKNADVLYETEWKGWVSTVY